MVHGQGRGLTKTPATAYDLPSADTFDARFDAGASTVTWHVSGSYTEGNTRYDYVGSGTKALTFKDAEGTILPATFSMIDGQTVMVDFGASVEMGYTETVTNLLSGDSTVTNHGIPLGGLSLGSIPVGDGLTLQGGMDISLSAGDGWSMVVSWEDAPPSPAFDPKTHRR